MSITPTERDRLAELIWDYHLMHQPLAPADVLLVFGSHDLRVASYAAELFLAGYAPFILFSGKQGHLTETWDRPEAEVFAEVAIQNGVPAEKVLIEDQATNTSENISFSRELLGKSKFRPKSSILVQKPYMERRTYATFEKVWPGQKVIVTSPPLNFQDFCNDQFPKEEIISILVGDLQRIKVYSEKGFQIPQVIPNDVWKAYESLVAAGYSRHLI